MNVRCDRQGDVVVLTLDRPHRLNSLDDGVTAEVLEALQRVSSDPSVGALVLTGSGRAFTAGGDLAMLADRARQVADGDAEGAAADVARVMRANAEVVERLRALHCPSIAAVNGACVGAGLAWVAACDLRLASGRAFFDTAYLKLGIGTDFGVAWLLQDLLGASVATDWLLRPRRIPAQEARDRGFVAEVIDESDGTTVLQAASELAAELDGVRAGARAIRENLRDGRCDGLAGALDREADRFVATLADPQTARRVSAASALSTTR